MRGLPLLFLVGWASGQTLVDTIGRTDRDLQMYGPAVRYLARDTAGGLHAVWKSGYGEIWYNYRPRSGGWRWSEGRLVNYYQRNLGCLDLDRPRRRAYISADYLWQGEPVVSYFIDSAAGAGRFTETGVNSGLRRLLVAASDRGFPKFAALARDTVYYLSLFGGTRLGEVGSYPTHNLAVSKQTGRFGYIWQTNQSGRLYLRETPNNGGNWYPVASLSDSVPSPLNLSPLGATAAYDTNRIHLVAGLWDGSDSGHVQLWHYTPYDTPYFHLIADLRSPVPVRTDGHSLFACRPSIGIDRARRELYAAWEQFDTENTDPRTGISRADVWACRSTDNGRTWGAPVRLTGPDSLSRRFPFLCEVVSETLRVICFGDRVAGTWEMGEGEPTTNPVLCLRRPAGSLPVAVSEPGRSRRAALSVRPSVSRSDFLLAGTAGPVAVSDACGRVVTVVGGPGRFGRDLGPGVYFIGPGRTRVVKTR